jgi:membrane protein implicated in regulation of membrane protease activity
MAGDPRQEETEEKAKSQLYFEDFLIFLGVAALFVLGVFFRETLWGQAGLYCLLAVMLYVFVRRFRRVHRAFKDRDEDTW